MLAGAGDAAPATRAAAGKTIDKPLAGLRVLDLGWVWSAPWVGGILGEFGARVIKVEHGGRPDNTRLAGRPIRNGQKVEGPTKEMSSMFHQINHGKLGVTLNAKEPRAVELLKRLAARERRGDREHVPGAMDRAGLGYEALRAVNPRIVYLSMAAAGQFGPLAQMRTYAPVMSSFVGLEALIGYRNEAAPRQPQLRDWRSQRLGARAGGARGCAAAHPAHGRGLLHRLVADRGDADHARSVRAERAGDRTPAAAARQRASRHGAARHLSCAGGGYVARRLPCRTTASGRRSPRSFRSRGRRTRDLRRRQAAIAHRDELDQALRTWTATVPRDALVGKLRAAGIAASPVLTIHEQWNDANYAARAVKTRVEIPYYGDDDLFKAPWHFSDMTPVIDRSGPTMGQHNREVFCEHAGPVRGRAR